MKGAGTFDLVVNVITIAIGVILILRGISGQTIEPAFLLMMGVVIVAEQLLDVVSHGH